VYQDSAIDCFEFEPVNREKWQQIDAVEMHMAGMTHDWRRDWLLLISESGKVDIMTLVLK
jgi:hypothetical protein